MTLPNILAIAALVFGFGFVVFFHELGHFLAAKWVGIKVEQFAVGFGHALFAFRKGLGFRVGSTTKEFEQRLRDHAEKKFNRRGDISATEYSQVAAVDGRRLSDQFTRPASRPSDRRSHQIFRRRLPA